MSSCTQVRFEFMTTRLSVCPWTAELSDPKRRAMIEAELKELLVPEVLEFLPESLALTGGENAIGTWIEERVALAQVCTARARADGALLGLLFAFQRDADDGREAALNLGYMFKISAWGHGFASELVAGFVSALPDIGTPQVLAGVARGNEASARVLAKNGFKPVAELSGEDLDMFELNAPN